VQGKPTVQLRVNDQQQQVCAILDTGFNSGVALTGEVLDGFALPQAAGHTMLAGFGGVRWQAPVLAPLEQVHFGTQHYRNVSLTEKKSGGEWECPNLLGMAVLSQHHVVFDLKHRRVWLLPRSAGIVSQR
jgi:predicted aspartyl protease